MFDELKSCYRNYIVWSAAYLESVTMQQRLMRFVNRNRDYCEKKEHMAFYNGVKEQAEILLPRFRSGEAEPGELAALLHYVFVDCYENVDKTTSLMMLSAEQHFIPFLPLLQRSSAAELAESYKKRRRKDPGLIIQKNISRQLKRLAD